MEESEQNVGSPDRLLRRRHKDRRHVQVLFFPTSVPFWEMAAPLPIKEFTLLKQFRPLSVKQQVQEARPVDTFAMKKIFPGLFLKCVLYLIHLTLYFVH